MTDRWRQSVTALTRIPASHKDEPKPSHHDAIRAAMRAAQDRTLTGDTEPPNTGRDRSAATPNRPQA
jgi:hypothetical protein